MALMTKSCEDPRLDLAAEILRFGGIIRLRGLGTSMLPAIWPGDVLSIETQHPEPMVPGDIVLVMRGSRFFVHRLIEKCNEDGSRWITRGDALPQNDPPVAATELLGKVSSIRRGRHVIMPRRRVRLPARALAWMLCHCDSFKNVTLSMHSIWQNHVQAGRFFGRVRHWFSGLSTAACAWSANEGNQPHGSN